MRTNVEDSAEPVFSPVRHEDVFEVLGEPFIDFLPDYTVYVSSVRLVYSQGFSRPGMVFLDGIDSYGLSVRSVHVPHNKYPAWLEKFVFHRSIVMASRSCSV